MIAVIKAPIKTMEAPASPEALADKSFRIEIIAKFALGEVNPLPIPTNIIPHKRFLSEINPHANRAMVIARPKHATQRPESIIVSRPYFEAYRPDKKLPKRNPHVIDPIQSPICPCSISN